jgi:hypothetical protein
MQKKSILSLIPLLLIFNLYTNGQTVNSSIPGGKPLALIFTNVNTSYNKNGNSKAFEITRAYLGYEYAFNSYFSSRVIIDVGDPGTGKYQMSAYLKNAYLQFKRKDLTARFGMIGVDQLSIQEKQWGYRYIYKTFQDAYKFGPTADLGMGLEYSPAEFISLDVSVLNGEGYTKIQSDTTFKKTVGLTLRPFSGLILRGYIDRMKRDYAQTSYALFAGYSTEVFRTGIEYNIQTNHNMINQNDYSGISVYASFNLNEKISLFTRYDNLWSETPDTEQSPWNYNRDGQIVISGFDYIPTKGIRIAPTYFGWSPRDKSQSFTSTIALNFEIRF